MTILMFDKKRIPSTIMMLGIIVVRSVALLI